MMRTMRTKTAIAMLVNVSQFNWRISNGWWHTFCYCQCSSMNIKSHYLYLYILLVFRLRQTAATTMSIKLSGTCLKPAKFFNIIFNSFEAGFRSVATRGALYATQVVLTKSDAKDTPQDDEARDEISTSQLSNSQETKLYEFCASELKLSYE